MHLIQVFKRINGKTEVINLAESKRIPRSYTLKLAELEDELKFYREAMIMAAKRYLIARAKLN